MCHVTVHIVNVQNIKYEQDLKLPATEYNNTEM